MAEWMPSMYYVAGGKQVASVILSPFNLMSDFAIRLGHARERERERDLKSIGEKANVIKGASASEGERGRIKLNRELCR